MKGVEGMSTGLEIVKALIECQVCGNEFWFEFKNERQECPWCGQRNYRRAIPKTAKRKEAGRLGGIMTFSRYGPEGMKERAKLGGRPKLPTTGEIRQQSASLAPLHKNEKEERLPNGLRGLKRLYLQRNGTGGG